MLVAINDSYEVEILARLKNWIVDEPANLYADWLAKNGWIVAPVLSGSHFTAEDTAWISGALTYVNCSELFAIATERLADTTIVYALTNSEEDLLAFSEEASHFNFALIPGDRSLAIVSTVFDYFLVAGPREFVRLPVHGDLAAAWRTFEEEAEDTVYQGYLQKVATRYRPFSGLSG